VSRRCARGAGQFGTGRTETEAVVAQPDVEGREITTTSTGSRKRGRTPARSRGRERTGRWGRQTIVDGLKLMRIAAAMQMQRFITEEFQPGLAVASHEERLDYARQRG
jgi:hypothetical protein